MAYQLSAVFDLGGNYVKEMAKAQAQTKSMNGSLSTVGGGFSKLASLAAKAGAVIGLGLGLKDMVTKAAAAQQKMAQLDSVLLSTKGAAGMSKDALLNLADAQSKVTTFSKGTTMAGESLMLTFTGIGKKTFPDTMKAAQDMSTAMGTDLNSSVMTLGKALNSPADGLAKLQKQGVTFTKAQKDQVKAMVAVGDVGGAQAVMLKELQKEFGGSANAAGKTFAGQLTILKNSMSGIESSLGTTLIPYLQKFATYINAHIPMIKQVLAGMIDYVVPKFKNMIDLIGQIAQSVLPSFGKSTDDAKTKASDLAKGGIELVIKALTWIRDNMEIVKLAIAGVTTVWAIQRLAVIANNIVVAISNGLAFIAAAKSVALTVAIVALYVAQGIGTAATVAGSVAMGIFNGVMSLNPIAAVILALAALGLGIYAVVKHWQEICTWIQKAWDWLTKWNNTSATDKNATVTTNYLEKGSTAGEMGNGIMGKAKGDKNWMGGPVLTQESGGEILNLPNHTQIIPHDVSMKMAETARESSNSANAQPSITINMYNPIGEKAWFDKASDEVSNRILTQLANM